MGYWLCSGFTRMTFVVDVMDLGFQLNGGGGDQGFVERLISSRIAEF